MEEFGNAMVAARAKQGDIVLKVCVHYQKWFGAEKKLILLTLDLIIFE
jgi:hypothetical protein